MTPDDALEACARAALTADFDPVPWDEAPAWLCQVMTAVARAALDMNSPDHARSAWFLEMTKMGWRWDREFNEQRKTHPGIRDGDLTAGGTKHWCEVVRRVREVGREHGVRMLDI